jgi:hypothetical protein
LGDRDNIGPKDARVIDFRGVDTTQVMLTLSDLLDRPLSGKALAVRCSVVPTSGGHDHQAGHLGTRPRGRFRTQAGDTVTTYSGLTDTNGRISLRYLSSGFGGVDSVICNVTGTRDTVRRVISLVVRGLELLTEGDHYDLIGAYGEPGVHSEHHTNHYGTERLRQGIIALADSLYARSGLKLRINDMSLESGGPFDILNQWNTPHQLHREGCSVDIDEKYSNLSVIPELTFRKILENPPFRLQFEKTLFNEGDHYHLTFR